MTQTPATTDHVDADRRSVLHQLARATEELRILRDMAGPEGPHFAQLAFETSASMVREDKLRLVK